MVIPCFDSKLYVYYVQKCLGKIFSILMCSVINRHQTNSENNAQNITKILISLLQGAEDKNK